MPVDGSRAGADAALKMPGVAGAGLHYPSVVRMGDFSGIRLVSEQVMGWYLVQLPLARLKTPSAEHHCFPIGEE